jgi:hypothetical protein
MDSICARDNSLNAKALGKEYGFIKTFNTFAEFMMRDVDAYLVVTDTNSQIPISRKLLAMDKPILVEKPGSINVQEIDSLKKEDKNERIVMAYNRRSMSSTRTLRSLLNEISTKSFILNVPELSTKPNPNKEEISYMILENAVHAFDLLFYLFGRPSTWTISKLDIDYLMFHRIINLNYSPSRTGIINLTIGTPDNWALTVYSRGSRYVLSPLEVFTLRDRTDCIFQKRQNLGLPIQATLNLNQDFINRCLIIGTS